MGVNADMNCAISCSEGSDAFNDNDCDGDGGVEGTEREDDGEVSARRRRLNWRS